jgi:flavocytochrome c
MESSKLPSRWDETTDVLVIGSGFAGLAATIEAKNAGSSVIIIEKMKGRGGNSIISDGNVSVAGSLLQKKDGIEDSPELLYKDMLKAGLGLNYPDLARIVAERSKEVLHWTIDYLGVKYKETVTQFGGHSVPRTHITYNQSGSGIVRPLLSKVKELGVEVRTHAYLEKLLQDTDDSVKGIIIRDGYVFPDAESGTPKYIKARRAVILTTGGFANDIAFRVSQDPRLTRDVDSTNRAGTTAEALTEAMRICATPVHLSWIQLGPWTSPDEKMYGVGPLFADYIVFPYGVMVDPATGRRFVNEMGDRKTCADSILNIGTPCVGIADTEGIGQSGQIIDKCLKRGVVKSFNVLEDLAVAYSIPFEALRETIDRYNGYVRNETDEEFGKPILKGSKPMVNPPYYGVRLWPKVHYTMGGIQINTKAQVIDLNHQPIERLYAAGEVTGGVHGACRLGGLSITECLIFGRIAGRNAAQER